MLSAGRLRQIGRADSPLLGARVEVYVSTMRHSVRRSPAGEIGLVAMLAIALLLGACSPAGTVRARDTVELELALARGTPVRVSTFNGGIDVATTEEPVVSASVTRTGEGTDAQAAETDRDAIAVTLELVDGVALLQAIYTPSPDSISGERGAAVAVRVPATTRLELSTSNGPITVQGTTGGLAAQTSNGPVELTGVSGSLSVSTSNGPVTVGASAPVALDLRTSNGGITFDGSLEPGDARLETSNGPIELRLPADAAFTIDASTSSASTTSEFDIAGTVSDRELKGVVGAPEEAAATTITLSTSNGAIELGHR